MLNPKINNHLKALSDYLVITIGIGLFVVSWSIFLIPHNLFGGGVSGMSAIIYYATGISMGLSNLLINAILLIAGFFILGTGFGFKTIYAIVISSVGLSFVPGLIPEDFVRAFVMENGKILCTIMGGVMTGVGIGLTFSRGGSTGGTDIIAIIINKYFNVSPGRMILMIDIFIILSSLLVPSYTQDGAAVPLAVKIANTIYAFIMVAVNSYSLDLFLTGTKQTVQIFIFSKKYEKLSDMVVYELDRGVTLLQSRGWYHKKESAVMIVVARKADLSLILRRIKDVDPSAFITVTSAMGVYGQGFDAIKGRKKIKITNKVKANLSQAEGDLSQNPNEELKS